MKILVIGLKPQHCRFLKEKFSKVKFTFLDSNTRVRGDKLALGNYDVVYSNYSFTNHSVEKVWSNHPNYVRISSYTHVVELLSSLFNA